MTCQFPLSAVALLCLVCIQITITEAVQTDSVKSPSLQHLSDDQILETWPEPHKNEPNPQALKEHSVIDAEGGDTFSPEESQNNLDDKRVWPYALGDYGYFLSHATPEVFAEAPTFSRIVRGRLGRMPISYGKREQSNTLDSLVTFDDDSIVPGDDTAFPRVARQRLSRMPIAFGKRLHLDSSVLSSLPQRQVRQALSRMPLTFGKRDSQSGDKTEESIFQRLLRSRLNRMPFAYGKRDNGAMQRSFRSRLSRMPFTYGKRNFQDSSASAPDNGVLVERRSRLNRMPVSFGKRGRLGRMPIAFGKRDGLKNDRVALTTLLGESQ